jgi:peptidoglycan/xylan/chitin deacetylase (PgdA/CDA1 family)
MSSGTPDPATTTYSSGSRPTWSGAHPLPSPFVFNAAKWPAQDKVVDPSLFPDQMAIWMKELDGVDIPDIPQTDGTCAGSPENFAKAAEYAWWSCGGHTRETDVTACPTKYTWGVSFDDGPGPYTGELLKYLDEKSVKATFFVVGSRVIERPAILIEEYMSGHEISVHTWSHRLLTTLTNEQIVAELGFTREAIKQVLGVTPTTMRPPQGDIDDRVRAISLAMGLVPIMWTSTPTAGKFDTNDWQVAAGLVTGEQSYQTFQSILGNASLLDTGFIVLQHDIHYSAVQLATGYTLDAALKHDPKFTLQPIGQCSGYPTADLYVETTTNATFPSNATKDSVNGVAINNTRSNNGNNKSGNPGSTSQSTSGSSSIAASAPFISGLLSVVGLLVTLL